MAPLAATTNHHRLQTKQKFISHSSGGREIQDQGTGEKSFILRPLLFVYN